MSTHIVFPADDSFSVEATGYCEKFTCIFRDFQFLLKTEAVMASTPAFLPQDQSETYKLQAEGHNLVFWNLFYQLVLGLCRLSYTDTSRDKTGTTLQGICRPFYPKRREQYQRCLDYFYSRIQIGGPLLGYHPKDVAEHAIPPISKKEFDGWVDEVCRLKGLQDRKIAAIKPLRDLAVAHREFEQHGLDVRLKLRGEPKQWLKDLHLALHATCDLMRPLTGIFHGRREDVEMFTGFGEEVARAFWQGIASGKWSAPTPRSSDSFPK